MEKTEDIEIDSSPRGYVDAMSQGKVWRSRNGYLNAVLVSVWKREGRLLDRSVDQGITFDIDEKNRRIFLLKDGEVVGVVSYRGGQLPRSVATRVLHALEERAGVSGKKVVRSEIFDRTEDEKPLVFTVSEEE